MEKALNNFIETYVEDSMIKEITYSNESKKWIVKYNYDVSDDEFKTTKGMIDFLHEDQKGD